MSEGQTVTIGQNYFSDNCTEFVAFEEANQSVMNDFYTSGMKWEIVNRVGDKGRDLVIKRKDRGEEKVEEKYREGDFGDFLIEVVQDLVSENRGWFYTTKADIISYIICKNKIPTSVYFVHWKNFKDWYLTTGYKNYRRQFLIISDRGYGVTLNIGIKWKTIPEVLYAYKKVKDE
jgi:hypothetical protein